MFLQPIYKIHLYWLFSVMSLKSLMSKKGKDLQLDQTMFPAVSLWTSDLTSNAQVSVPYQDALLSVW